MRISARIQNWLVCWVFFSVVISLAIIPSVLKYGAPNTLMSMLYLPLAVIGQGFALSFVIGLLTLLPSLILPRWTFLIWAILGGSILFLLLVDTQVFRVYRFHLNSFFINMFFTNPKGMGVGWVTVVLGLLGFSVVIGISNLLIKGARNFIPRAGFSVLFLFVLTFIGQSIHAWGYAHNMKSIVSLTHYIPWYVPMTATGKIKKWGLYNQALLEENIEIGRAHV